MSQDYPLSVRLNQRHEPLVTRGGFHDHLERSLLGEPGDDPPAIATMETLSRDNLTGLVHRTNHDKLLVEVDADELLHGSLLVWKQSVRKTRNAVYHEPKEP
jgi:hypothetical protein